MARAALVRIRLIRVLALFLLLLPLAACMTAEPSRPCLAGQPATETQLYFGLSTTHGSVTALQWQRFVETEISPRFPQGFSVTDVRGAWLSQETKSTISENSKLLIRVHDGSAADNEVINAIIDAYKRAFAQESVMRVDQAICVTF